MPIYLYRNPITDEIVEVVQGMNDEHSYSEDGVEFERVFTVPQAANSLKVDPFSQKQFLEKTDKAGTIGDVWDRAKELSEKRKEKAGKDDLQYKYFDDYSKKRKGRKHPNDPR